MTAHLAPCTIELLAIARDEGRWGDARPVFNKVRRAGLASGASPGSLRDALQELVETCAKTIYNASGGPSPYDAPSVGRVLLAARRVLETTTDHATAIAETLEAALLRPFAKPTSGP